MANRYWIGGTGNWNDSAHWSTTSGGTGGASIPTSSDSVYFNANSFTGAGQTVTVNVSANCLDMNWTGANNPTLAGGSSLSVYGDLTFISNMSHTMTNSIIMSATTSKNIRTNGLVLSGTLTIMYTKNLLDSLVITNGVGTITQSGTLYTNNFNVTCKVFSNTANLHLGSSIITCSSSFDNQSGQNVFADTSTIKVVGSFYPGSKTYYNVELTGTTSIYGNGTYNDLKLTTGCTYTFSTNGTHTVTTLSGDGTIGNLITIKSTSAGTKFTISKSSGTLIKNYYSIKDCWTTGGATFQAVDSTSLGNNSGWQFPLYTGGASSGTTTVTATAINAVYASGESVGETSVGLTIYKYKILKTGLTAQKGSFFKFNSKLYYINGHEYIVYDGTTASVVVPYIPTVIINRTPTGGGNANEQYNRIGKGFKNSFHGNGTTTFTLTDTNLDATAVTAIVNGVNKVETTDFTVNRTTGVVTFSVAPPNGTNNVDITAYKTVQADIDSILNCLYTIAFGGQNDNRMFFGGNGSGYYYWTGISTLGVDATYIPWNNYNIIGLTDEDITGFVKHYDTLTIHKESGEIFGETYSWNGTEGVFNTFPIASRGGCDCPGTLDVVNNSPVWLNSQMGACTLLGTQVNSQRNVFPISRNVDPWLLRESNLKDATAANFGGKYWLCVNDKVYLWDYFLTPYVDTGNPDLSAKQLSWWYFDSINAGGWIVTDELMYFDRTTGVIAKFYDQFYDFGNMINAVYRYPIREMGGGIYEFSVLNGWVQVRGDTRASYKVQYITSDDIAGDPATEFINVGSFSWARFSWAYFTWAVTGPLINWELSPYEKNVRYFGCEFTNTRPGADMNISGLSWRYKLGKMIR